MILQWLRLRTVSNIALTMKGSQGVNPLLTVGMMLTMEGSQDANPLTLVGRTLTK